MMNEDNARVHPDSIRVSLKLVSQLLKSGYEGSYHCVKNDITHVKMLLLILLLFIIYYYYCFINIPFTPRLAWGACLLYCF